MEKYISIFLPIASVLFFVAYYHPSAYRRIDSLVMAVCVLISTALFSYHMGVHQAEMALIGQSLTSDVIQKVRDLQPPFGWFIFVIFIYATSLVLCFLPHMGITRESRDPSSKK